MAIRIIYDQTLAVTANGEVTGWIKVQDVTQVVPGCLGFIYDQDTGPVAIRIEAIDFPNSKLQLSVQDNGGTYVIGSLTAYTVAGGSKVKIPQQAREDSGYVPPASGAIAGIVAGGSTASSGFVTFGNSNGITFGMNNNVLTASGGGGGAAISAGTNVQSTGTVVFSNQNGLSFGLDTNGALTGSYTVPTVPAQTEYQFSNSNNVSFGTNGSTVTASASFPAQTQFVLSNSNGLVFGTNGSTVTGSYTVPVVPPQTSLVYSNSNNVSFGVNGSTLTATATFPAQTVQPVAASASNGSFNFSTLRFVEGSGVTWATQAGGIQASVKTDYQSSNANYLTSQSNQAVSGSNGSFAFQTLSLGASNGVSFYTTNGSIVASYTVPTQTVQPVAASGSNGSFAFSTLSFGASNGVTFATSNGSIIATVRTDYQSAGAYLTTAAQSNHSHGNPSLALTNLSGTTASNSAGFSLSLSAAPPGAGGGIAAAAGTQTQTSGTLQFVNSNGITFGMSNSSQITASYTVPNVPAQTSLVFSNSNNVSFGVNGSTLTATATFNQTVQPVAVSGANGSFAFSTLTLANSNGVSFSTGTQGVFATVKTDYQSSNANYLTSQSNQAYSGANGSATFQTLSFANSNGVTFSTGTQGLFASVRTDYQSSNANYLTSQSNQAVSAANGSSTFQTLSLANSNGVSFSTGTQGIFATVKTDYQSSNANYLTSQSVQPVAASGSNGSFVFSTLSFGASNGLSFYTTNGSVVGVYTVPTVTNSTAPGAIAVAGSTITAGTVVFSNSNGVSFGANGNTITVTVQPGAAAGLAAASAGTQQATSGTLQFVNSNGITFGMSNSSQITASHNGLTQQSTQPVAVSGSNGSFAFSTLTMGASNGLTFYTTNGSVVGSYTVPTVPGATVFSNSNNVSFGLNGSTITATATFAQSVQPVAVSAANGSVAFSTLTLANSNGVSFSTGTQGVFATVKTDYQSSNANYLTSQSNQAVSGANGSFTFQTLTFANSNGVTFSTGTQGLYASVQTNYLTTARASNDAIGLNTALTANGVSWTVNSSGLSLNVPAFLTTAAQSNHSHGNPTLALTNLTGTTASASNGFTLSLSAGAGGTVNQTGPNIADGNGNTITSGTVVFSNANGVSFGLNGSTMTASVDAGGGGGYTAFTYQNRQLGASSHTAPGNNSVWLVPMRIVAPVSASSLLQMISVTGSVTSNQTNTVGATFDVMLYKNTAVTNGSRFDSIWSARMGLTVWNSGTASVSYSISGIQNTSGSSAGSNLMTASVYGLRQMTFSIGSTLDTGLYAYGFRMSTSSAGQSSILRTFNPVIDNPVPVAQGFIGSATNQSIGYVDGGTYATTSTAMPTNFELSQIRQTNNAVPYVKIGAI